MTSKSAGSCLPLFLFICVLLFVTSAQSQRTDDCQTPRNEAGICKNIRECAPVLDLLKNAPRPLSTETMQLLQRYACGFDGSSPKVCCPNESGADNIGGDVRIPDVTRHRNVRLIPQTNCGKFDTADRILFGNKTSLFEFPWMALLAYNTGNNVEYLCGGSVINNRYVLTAAHCVNNLGTRRLVNVRLGEHNLATKIDCEKLPEAVEETCRPEAIDVGIERVIPHESYSATSLMHDIALLRLSRAVEFSQETILPICLPILKQHREFEFKKGVVTGWGTTESARNSKILLKAELQGTPFEECKQIFARQVKLTPRQLCAGGKKAADSCQGDSGGPMQTIGVLSSDARYFQYGIVSFGPKPCGRPGVPGVYTNIPYYMDWILDNLRD